MAGSQAASGRRSSRVLAAKILARFYFFILFDILITDDFSWDKSKEADVQNSLIMSLIISSVFAVVYYKGMSSFLSTKGKTLKEKGINGITPRLLLDKYRRTGLTDEQIIDKLITSCQNGKKWIPIGTVIGFIFVFTVWNFFIKY